MNDFIIVLERYIQKKYGIELKPLMDEEIESIVDLGYCLGSDINIISEDIMNYLNDCDVECSIVNDMED